MEQGAFGAGKAGTTFNPVEFVQRPQVILRLLNIVSINTIVCSFWSQRSHVSRRRYIDSLCVCWHPHNPWLTLCTIFCCDQTLISVKPCFGIYFHSLVNCLFCYYLTLQLFSIIVFGSISSKGYQFNGKKEVCLYNSDGNACNYGVGIGTEVICPF